jgi:transposase InsO family protein
VADQGHGLRARQRLRFEQTRGEARWRLGHERRLDAQLAAEAAVFDFIEGWYNPTRRHSSLDYLSPVEFERRAVSGPAPPEGADAGEAAA